MVLIPFNDDIKAILLSRKKLDKLFANIFIGMPGNHMQQIRRISISQRKANRFYNKDNHQWFYSDSFIYPKSLDSFFT